MKTVLFSTLLAVLVACNPGAENTSKEANQSTGTIDKKEEAEKPSPSSPATKDVTGCYMRVIKRDTLAASLQQSGNRVTGRLSFDNYEKDGSTGTVTGNIEGDILKLTYTFQSEGMESVMDVFFKVTGDGIIHGIGDIDGNGRYTNQSGISYPADNLLRKINCTELPAKYK